MSKQIALSREGSSRSLCRCTILCAISNSSPEVNGLTVMMNIRSPLSLRQVEDVLFERGVDICHETVRSWWNRFGPLIGAEIRQRRVHGNGKTI